MYDDLSLLVLYSLINPKNKDIGVRKKYFDGKLTAFASASL